MNSLWQQIKELKESELVKNSTKLLSANVIAQVVGLLIYPILTIFFMPDDFGLLNLFLSIGGVIIIVANAEIQYSVVLPKSEKRAIACFHNGFFCIMIVSLICVVAIPLTPYIASLFNAPELNSWLKYLPLYVFFSALWILLNFWFTRKKAYGKISKYQLMLCGSTSVMKCSAGYIGLSAISLLISTIIGQLIALSITLKSNFYKLISQLFIIDKEECCNAIKEYANFPKYSLPRALINYFSGNLPYFMLTPYFGLTEIGFLGMAFTLAYRPLNMVCNSINQVLFQKVSEMVQNGKVFMPILIKFVRNTMFLAIPVFIALYFVLPQLTAFLLGDKWATTGEYISIMLPWLLLVCVNMSLNFIPDIFQKQRGLLIFEIIYIMFRIISLIIGISSNNFRLAIVLYSLTGVVVLVLQCIWFYFICKRYHLSISKK